MINVREYRTGDMERARAGARDHGYLRPPEPAAVMIAEAIAEGRVKGLIQTAEIDGAVAAVAFVCQTGIGIGEISMVETALIETCPKDFEAASRVFVDSINGFRRVYAYCAVTFTRSYFWLKRLGFRCEGVLEGMAPDGTDCFLMARMY